MSSFHSVSHESSFTESAWGASASTGGATPDLQKVMPEFRESYRAAHGGGAGPGGIQPPPQRYGVEKIFPPGGDDRQQVLDPNRPPFHSICELEFLTHHGETRFGTGWFISPKLILTVGHNVYRLQERNWIQRMIVRTYGAGSVVLAQQTATRFRCNNVYLNTGDRTADFAAVILSSSWSVPISPFEVAAYGDSQLQGLTANIVGFPVDKPRGTMWGHADKIQPGAGGLLYRIDTYGGHSGSPIYEYFSGSGGAGDRFVGVGIHQGHVSTSNFGVRITQNVLALINQWRSEAG